MNPYLTAVFQISEIYVSGESGDLTAKEKLLLWSQKASEGWPGLRCTNFSSSWSDGRMFNALLHRFRYTHNHSLRCMQTHTHTRSVLTPPVSLSGGLQARPD